MTLLCCYALTQSAFLVFSNDVLPRHSIHVNQMVCRSLSSKCLHTLVNHNLYSMQAVGCEYQVILSLQWQISPDTSMVQSGGSSYFKFQKTSTSTNKLLMRRQLLSLQHIQQNDSKRFQLFWDNTRTRLHRTDRQTDRWPLGHGTDCTMHVQQNSMQQK